MSDSKIITLAEATIEMIVNELKRRAVAKGMTVDELVTEAQKNWQDAEDAAGELEKKGHEQ